MQLGYACICLSIPEYTTNRTMRKATFNQKGMDYVSDLTLQNVSDIIHILKWNRLNGINFFRLSSCLIPWGDKLDITKLKDYKAIAYELKLAGQYATDNGIRITTHPGPFCILSSPNDAVVQSAIDDLEMHGKIFDLMGLSQSPYNKINIHMGGTYGDKVAAMDRFSENFKRLSPSVQSRLTIENDDKASLYSVSDLMHIHQRIGIPIVFDYHHHQCQQDPMSQEDALKLAASTWPIGIPPVVHYSESKALHENDPKIKVQAHSDYITALPNTYGVDVDIMVEAKKKDWAILPFLHLQSQNKLAA
jgi:UV DNA damage endonuclease